MANISDSITGKRGFNPVRTGALIAGGMLIVGVVALSGKLFENLEAGNVMIIQSVGGTLNCYTSPGPYWQGFGDVTKYPRQTAYLFDVVLQDKEGNPVPGDTGKDLTFNDGGKARLYGSVNWEMPLDCKQIVELHQQFTSPEGIEARGVSKMVNLAVNLSGLAMSSTESVAERRGELVELINDQAQKGVHQTTTRMMEKPDPITGEKKTIAVVEIVRDAKGLPMRQQGSILEQYGIHLQPMTIEKISYSRTVEAQVAARQVATQQVQLAQANARKAEQDAITVEKQGQAKAAEAKWAQEAIRSRVVTEAQQKLDVATLSAKEAEQYKTEQILRGTGDAERKRLVLAADGALDQKLEAYKQVQAIWATSFANFHGAMVPSVVMGGGAGANTTAVGSAQSLVDLLTAKTSRDLSLDLSNAQGATVGKK